jgi:hypothetical protein
MQVWDRLKTAFDTGGEPKLPPKLDASSEDALSRSIRILPVGNRGWITIREARVLFKPLRDEYTLGDFDEEGKGKIARFAARGGIIRIFILLRLRGSSALHTISRRLAASCHRGSDLPIFCKIAYFLQDVVTFPEAATPGS